MVLPYLEYANCFMVGCNLSDKNKLQRIQNRGLKIALARDRLASTAQIHADARISTLEARTKMALCRLIFKHKYNEEYIDMRGLETWLHDGPIFNMDTPKTDWFARSSSYTSRKLWNSLPSEIRLIDDYNHFKLAIKGHFKTIQPGEGGREGLNRTLTQGND